MKLRTRLLATFGLLALTTFSISIVGYLLVSRFSGALYEVGVVRLPSIQGLDTMREALHELARAEHRRHRATEDSATMKAEIALAGRQWQRFDEGLGVYEPLARVPQEAELWRRFVAVIAEVRPLHEAAMARALARTEEVATGKSQVVVADESHLAGQLNSAEDLLAELLRLNTRIAENALAGTARTSDEVANVGHVMLGFAAFALFLHVWLAFSIGRSVTRPVEDAERAIRRIAGGDLGARVPVYGDDEPGRLSGSVNHLAVALQEGEALRRAVGTNLPRSFVYQIAYQPDRGWRFVSVSPSVERLVGITPSALISDHTQLERFVCEEDRPKLLEVRHRVQAGEPAVDLHVRGAWPGEELRDFHVTSAPRRLADGSLVSDGIVTDVTERIDTERALAAAARALRTTSSCRHAIVCASDEVGLVQSVCDAIVAVGGYRLCWVGYREDDDVRSVRGVAVAGHADFERGTPPTTWADDENGHGPLGTAIRTGERQVFEDAQNHPRYAPWKDYAVANGIHTILAFPLKEEGVTFGAFSIFSEERGPLDPSEVELFGELSLDIERGIVGIRNRERRDRALEELRVSEAQFRSVVEQSRLGVGIVAPDGRWLEVNDALCRIAGATPEELIATDVVSLTHPEEQEENRLLAERIVAGEVAHAERETRWLRKDGSVVWVRSHISAVVDPDGRLLHVIVHVVDETSRHEVEQHLRASRARMQLALDMSKLVYLEYDFDSDLIRFDEGFREIFLWPDDDTDGVVLSPREYVSRFLFPEDAHLVMDDLEMVRSRGELPFGTRLEHRFLRADGSDGVLSVSRTIERDPGSGALRLRGAIQDISELERLRQQLGQAQKMEAVGQLAGGVAHDFNNYLTVILGYSQMILPTFDLDDPRRHRLEEILKAAERSASLTAQLLAFSRRELIVPRLLNLNTVIEDTGKMLRRLVGEDIEVVHSLDPGLQLAWFDAGQLQQVLVNLAVNARDAMPRGGALVIETANVHVSALQVGRHSSIPPGSYVRLLVRDSGTGIAEGVQRQMFEPFFTTKGPGRGTGLGLSVVYGAVQQSGGHIDVESVLGEGTSFFVYLPSGREEEGEVSAANGKTPSTRGTETILVVEDEASIRDLNCELLAREGYSVLAATDGEDAIAVCARHEGTIDLLVTDVVMPRMSGGELAARLGEGRPELHVLFVTGYTDDAVLRQGIAREEVEFLQKPYSGGVLLARVRELLDAARAARGSGGSHAPDLDGPA